MYGNSVYKIYLKAFVDTATNNAISTFHCERNLLANPVDEDKLHGTTLINLFLKPHCESY